MVSSTISETRRPDLSQFDYTVDLLAGLNDEELEAVQSVAMAFIRNNRSVDISLDENTIHPFQPQTETQLLKRIDHSLEQIQTGQYSDAEEVEAQLLSELPA